MAAVLANLPVAAMAAPHALLVAPSAAPLGTPSVGGLRLGPAAATAGGGGPRLFFHPLFPLLHLMHLPHLFLHKPFGLGGLGGFGHHHHFGLGLGGPFGHHHFPFRSATAGNSTDETRGAPLRPLPPPPRHPYPFTSYITPTGQVVPAALAAPAPFLPYAVQWLSKSASPPLQPLLRYQEPPAPPLTLVTSHAGTFLGPALTSGDQVIEISAAAAAAPPPGQGVPAHPVPATPPPPAPTPLGTIVVGDGPCDCPSSDAPAASRVELDHSLPQEQLKQDQQETIRQRPGPVTPPTEDSAVASASGGGSGARGVPVRPVVSPPTVLTVQVSRQGSGSRLDLDASSSPELEPSDPASPGPGQGQRQEHPDGARDTVEESANAAQTPGAAVEEGGISDSRVLQLEEQPHQQHTGPEEAPLTELHEETTVRVP